MTIVRSTKVFSHGMDVKGALHTPCFMVVSKKHCADNPVERTSIEE